MRKPTTQLRVGLLGEAPNDTIAIGRLLEKEFGSRIKCFPILNDIRGSRLDDIATDRALRLEYEEARPHIVVVIRDLDGLEGESAKLRNRRAYFRRISKIVEQRSVYLLNIYTIEALLLTDLDVVNAHYGCECAAVADPMHVEKPIDVLRTVTNGQYVEGHCRELFPKLDYARLTAGCRYFAKFDREFSARLATPRPLK